MSPAPHGGPYDAPVPRPRPPAEARRADGKALRDRLPRSGQGAWAPAPGRDPVALLTAAAGGRLTELLPHKWARMARSPFAFFRGAAPLFAADLGPAPATGLEVQLCGDAHLLNLGAYAAPDGHLVFDLNDFDEACRGPWEWDLKRMAASVVLAARESRHGEGEARDAVRALVAAWREGLDRFAGMSPRELVRHEVSPPDSEALRRVLEKARRDTPERLLARATEDDGAGGRRFPDRPPELRPLPRPAAEALLQGWPAYRASLPPARQQVLDLYAPRDLAAKLSGVGSVGSVNVLVLAQDDAPEDALFLQLKSQEASCWAPWRPEAWDHHGRRVAEAQQRLQTWADPFLGWTRADWEGRPCDFLVRQWSDHKAAMDVEDLEDGPLQDYVRLCGRILAKAHARTGDPAALAGYAGDSDKLDEALADFAAAYADQAERDHGELAAALRAGKLPSP